ncbi:uncharacterized protein METZ01_LOCUS332224, partial [marine metagenome]
GECSCDLDCGLNIDFGGLYDDIVPLVNGFATGLKGNLPLTSASGSDWTSHITGDYSARESDARFPKLDNGTGEYGQLLLREAWSDFTAIMAPALPADPLKDGQQMEAMIALSGVQALGSGFVPLGLGLALDCTEGDCQDREAGGYDGQVNGGMVCSYSLDEAENRCSSTVLAVAPEGQLPDGHLPVMRAPAFGGLEGKTQARRTVILALPLTELIDDASQVRASVIVVNEDIGTGMSSVLEGRTFPSDSGMPAALAGRTYSPTVSLDAHWITVASDDVEGGVTTRWNVYMVGDAAFTAPMPPDGTTDPFSPLAGTGMVNVTHLGMSLGDGAESLASL